MILFFVYKCLRVSNNVIKSESGNINCDRVGIFKFNKLSIKLVGIFLFMVELSILISCWLKNISNKINRIVIWFLKIFFVKYWFKIIIGFFINYVCNFFVNW